MSAPARRRPRSLLDTLPLLATPLALLLPALLGAAALGALLALWLWRRPSRREVLATPLLVVALLALLATGIGERLRSPAPAELRHQAEARYRALWTDIGGHARDAARALREMPVDVAGRLAAHERLAALLRHEHTDLTLLLVDPDGQPLVWEGRGLLHEPRPEEMRRSGFEVRAGFGSATLLAIVPLSDDARPWRAVAGRSFTTHRLPFSLPGLAAAGAYRWALVDDPAQAAPGAVLLRAPNAPSMAIERRGVAPLPWLARERPLAAALLALALLAVAAVRAVGLAVLWGTTVPPAEGPLAVVALAIAGAVAAAAAGGASSWAVMALACGLALAAIGWLRRGVGPRRIAVALAAGAVTATALIAVAAALQEWLGPLAMNDFAGGATTSALRLGLLGAAAGLLALAGGRGAAVRGKVARSFWSGERIGGAAAVALVAAAALHDRWWIALPLLVVGGGLMAAWTHRTEWPARPAALVPLLLSSALLAATAWQTAYRWELQRALAERYLPALQPPTRADLGATWKQIDAYFAGVDLARQAPRKPEGLRATDLAYLLWRSSPLDRANALTALVVVPHGADPVGFAYGLPLTDRGTLDQDPVRWEPLGPASWRDLLLAGEVPLHAGNVSWGVARVWLLPQPGFRAGLPRQENLSVGLLRGGPAGRAPSGLPAEVRYALFAPGGAAQVSPWRESPPLPPALAHAAFARVETPEGAAWAAARRESDGTAVLFLPALTAGAALEAAGTLALSMLLLVLGGAALGALVALTRTSFRHLLRRVVRSYSKRLLLVYGLLLLVPLVALNILLLRNLEARLLAEQRAAGEAAVRSAQQVLGEYVLSLEPGFGVETALDDQLLVWLSRVLHHEVNLYWGASINASSKRELFSSGLLPERIPGDIYARLLLLHQDLAWRTSRAGGTTYLEIYAPLRVPGMGGGEPRLFLSLPLLAQQRELQSELSELRRRAVLLTAAVFLVAAALGTRLARTFTRPIRELVEGTRRIAGGATALDLAPSEQELAALVAAIDEMARRIADARQRLLREKQVVERMVENIQSGVVSLDRGGRVLLANRVAAELLGTRIGEPLVDALREEPALQPVAAFLALAGNEAEERTVRLEPPHGGTRPSSPADGESHAGADEREFRLAWVPIPGAGEPSALLVIEDATEVLRSQRLQAWAEMARIIAHEIKNPLTPIRLSTEFMVEVHHRDPQRFDEVFERCASNILQQVDELQEIAQEFSTYSRIPRLDPRPGDLAAAVHDLVESYRTASPGGVALRYAADPPAIPARFDERLLRRAVRNLIENSLRANAGKGEVAVRVERHDGTAQIAVRDQGPGVPPELLQRIFDPYFSTHDTGTGLGLPIARRIVEEHGGSIAAHNRPSGGLEVVIMIPVE